MTRKDKCVNAEKNKMDLGILKLASLHKIWKRTDFLNINWINFSNFSLYEAR